MSTEQEFMYSDVAEHNTKKVRREILPTKIILFALAIPRLPLD